MATRVLPFKVTIPPGTTIAAPQTTPLALDGWQIERIDLEVPAGPAGLMGFQIYNNGVPYIPYGPGAWIVWDDKQNTYYLDDLPNAGGWACVGYNLDGFNPHAVTLRFHCSPASTADTATAPTPVIIQSSPPSNEVVTL